MEINQDIINQLQTTPVKATRSTVSSEQVAAALERHGWLRSIAGNHDFDVASKGIAASLSTESKGILLVSKPGIGKTALLKALYEFPHRREKLWLYCNNKQHLAWLENAQISGDYNEMTLYLDDFGCEEVRHEFGNIYDTVGDFIQHYHTYGHGRLNISTNLTAKEINNKYGGRVIDRLLDMCVVINLTGKSKRQKLIFS